jgi:hypothetical protein
MVLTMVYNTQNYWVFGLFPSSGILQNIKHDVSVNVFVSVFRWGAKTPDLSKGPNPVVLWIILSFIEKDTCVMLDMLKDLIYLP